MDAIIMMEIIIIVTIMDIGDTGDECDMKGIMKVVIMILGLILLINMLAIVGSCSEHTIHVYGTVELDGESVEDADVVVTNIDKSYHVDTTTDDDGYYEIYISSGSHDNIKVEVEFDDYEDDTTFKTESHEYEYEVNFEFELDDDGVLPVKKTYRKVVNFAFGFHWGLWEWLICIFAVLFIFCMIKRIVFNGNGGDDHYHHHYHNGYRYRKYK